jgi:bacterioferritin-associated ferredoxin
MARKLFCLCNEVEESEVRKAIRKGELYFVPAVSEATGAGTGCGRCRSRIQELINEEKDRLPTIRQLKLEL